MTDNARQAGLTDQAIVELARRHNIHTVDGWNIFVHERHAGHDAVVQFAHAVIADFLDRAGQYVTNDASREAAIADALAAQSADASNAEAERFFQDHGLWHDRVTGQHMYTQDQYDQLRREAFHNGYASRNEEIELAKHKGECMDAECQGCIGDASNAATGHVDESALTSAIWQRICELPDRNSPEGEPDACVLNLREFTGCMANALEDLNLLQPQGIAAPAAPAPKLTPHPADVEQMLDRDAPEPATQADATVKDSLTVGEADKE